MCPHCKRGFTICSHCNKAGHTEYNCFEKHPERRGLVKTAESPSSSRSKAAASSHLTHFNFTPEQIKSERNFQLMINNPEFKKLHPDSPRM
jgi:hypothetical protein